MSTRNRFSRSLQFSGIVALACGFFVGPAFADKAYDRCLDLAGTNAAWSACGVEYLDRLDDTLNAAWQRVFPELSSQGQELLRTEQRAWNAFKESSCLYYGTSDYGREGQVLQLPMCRGQIIEDRIDYLEGLGDFGRTGE